MQYHGPYTAHVALIKPRTSLDLSFPTSFSIFIPKNPIYFPFLLQLSTLLDLSATTLYSTSLLPLPSTAMGGKHNRFTIFLRFLVYFLLQLV